EKTRDRIKDLMPEGSISGDTRLVLTTAIYLKGNWSKKFPKEATHHEAFNLDGGKTAQVPLMRLGGKFQYHGDDDFQAISLPYAGDELSMVVLLPRKADGLAAMEKALSPEKLRHWLADLARHDGDVLLP